METQKNKWLFYATGICSFFYGLAGLYWASGGKGFPYGDPEAASMGSFFPGAEAGPGGIIIAVSGLLGAVLAVAMAATLKPDKNLRILSVLAWTACALLTLVVPDIRLLRDFGYGLIGVFQTLDFISLNQFYCFASGILWGLSALSYSKRARRAISVPQLAVESAQLTAKWKKRGEWAVCLAILASLPWPLIRLSWFAGYPLGIGQEVWDQMNSSVNGTDPGFIKYLFGSLPLLGSLLTLGLVRRWGEIIPRWIPFAGGKPVPPALAIVPGALVALILTMAGSRMFGHYVPDMLQGGFDTTNWAVSLPVFFFLPWGVFLGIATLAYYYRRAIPAAATRR